ncbi:hypothetical protein [Paenibacillus sp. HB172176]|uniref:hypothetical protein n=1 Tax=Paenibacillus sp. HB172176 TaxID=2493690 RepID=UPI001439456B|nr:hypothetical protein [Paenibacillus sp. HB172176]
MRSKEEAIMELRQMAQRGIPHDQLVLKDVIAEEGELVLVRDMQLTAFSGKLYPAVHYELWRSRVHYELGDYAPEDGTIPYTGYATTDEQGVLQQFQALCKKQVGGV